MLDLESAIKHCEEVADLCEFEASKYDTTNHYENSVAGQEGECAAEHRQLAEWLKDYKRLKEQEPKTGHWIMTNDYLTTAYGSMDYVKCSCCGEDSLEEGNYCPNCGQMLKWEE